MKETWLNRCLFLKKINDCDSYNKSLQRSNKVIVIKKLFFGSEKLASDKDKPLSSSIADFVQFMERYQPFQK